MIREFGLVIDVELDTLEDSLDDILLGSVAVEKVFGDIGEGDLIAITTCGTSVQDPEDAAQDKKE